MPKKPKVVFISHLKPADDVRTLHKLAASIDSKRYDITIMAPGHPAMATGNQYQFYLLGNYRKHITARIRNIISLLKFTRQVKPDIIIPNHTELLYVALYNKILFGSIILYDLQENTSANVQNNPHLPALLRWLAASLYFVTEKAVRPFINWYIPAENTYLSEMGLPVSKTTITPNTFIRSTGCARKKPQEGRFRLIYSGTIAETYGVFEAVRLSKHLHEIDNRYQLTIIGFCPEIKVLKQLRDMISGLDFIMLKTGDNPLPHQQILMAMKGSDIALLPYQFNESTKNRIPTKWYECLGIKLPMILSENTLWKSLPYSDDAAIFIAFDSVDPCTLHAQVQTKSFYNKEVPSDIFWEHAAVKFSEVIDKMNFIRQA